MIEMINQLCVINVEFHDTSGDSSLNDRIAIIVHAKDFNTINHEIESKIENDEITSLTEFSDYLVELDDRGMYYREVSKFYLHEVIPSA